jgi:hypothetical protein
VHHGTSEGKISCGIQVFFFRLRLKCLPEKYQSLGEPMKKTFIWFPQKNFSPKGVHIEIQLLAVIL